MRAILMLVLIGCLCRTLSAQTQPAPSLVMYRSEQYGFQMNYFSSWAPRPGVKPWIMVSFLPVEGNDIRSRAAVGSPVIQGALNLEAIADAMVSEMKAEVSDAKVTIAAESKLGGEKAWRIILSGTKSGIPMRLLVIAAIHKDKPYAVGIYAPVFDWDRARDGFDKLIGSFEFIDSK